MGFFDRVRKLLGRREQPKTIVSDEALVRTRENLGKIKVEAERIEAGRSPFETKEIVAANTEVDKIKKNVLREDRRLFAALLADVSKSAMSQGEKLNFWSAHMDEMELEMFQSEVANMSKYLHIVAQLSFELLERVSIGA